METEKSRLFPPNFGKKLLFAFSIVLFISFFLLLLIIQPIWFDVNRFINDMTDLNINWILIIAILIIGVIGIEIYRYVYHFSTLIVEEQHKPKLGDYIRIVFFNIFCVALTVVLLSEMGNEKVLIKYGFLSILPWIFFGISLTLFILIQPKLASLWKRPLKIKAQAIGTNLLLGMLIIASVSFINNPSMGKSTMNTEPYLQYLGENSFSIMWLTNRDSSNWVQYGLDDTLEHKVYSMKDGLKDVSQIGTVTLENLTAGSTYYYKVFSQEIKRIFPINAIFGKIVESDLYQFTVPQTNPEELSFLLFSDIHEQSHLFSPLLELGGKSPYDIVFLDGDILNHVDSPQQIADQMITPLTDEFASEIPFVFVRGNHETRGELSRDFLDYIDTPTGNYYYSFNLGPVHFTILDSGEDKDDSHEEYSGLNDFSTYREAQTAWLEKEVVSDAYINATYRIVLVHAPLNEYLTESDAGSFLDYQQVWCDLLNSTGTDMTISGHHHENVKYASSSEFNPYNFPMIVTGGYELEDQAILRCDISATGLELYVLQDDGTVEGERVLEYTITA
ncbi:hypothetical protein NEF87_003419 [Candidatus Lokiarchaeum ossiferum]|uniref:Calcineurin-like phosphoesterase domain-containing protein n=1 Tax=Candidatus Lokiarchaeum ossiferum TaxID=2951803 RepID=A0ABY6HX48_9ARCH|nr:hypothetical protein NEF87_003419 [Candidatus Lokiarchaeum sp. B-35]